MALTGMVDKRTLDKYEKEAKERSRESWYLSWALDTNQEGKSYSNSEYSRRSIICTIKFCVFICIFFYI